MPDNFYVIGVFLVSRIFCEGIFFPSHFADGEAKGSESFDHVSVNVYALWPCV